MRIRLDGINKDFGRSRVLHEIALDAEPGELMALLGPSGSGKTTLLRIVGGLEQQSEGRVLFGEEDTTRWPIQQRRVGFVFQHYALFRHMSVLENVAFGLRALPRAQRPTEAAIRARVQELLALVHLDGTAGRYPAQLSGGQQQRVALARALAIDPRVLLLDEPFGALDAQVRKELRRSVRQIHDRTHLTTLFVTHDQDEALELADRIAILHQGRLVQVGTPDQIFDEPVNRFVHEFVGESSVLHTVVQSGRVTLDGQPLHLIGGHQFEGPADLLFRPQHVVLTDPGPSAIAARVRSAHRVGARYRIEADVAGGNVVEIETAQRPPHGRGELLHFQLLRWRLYPPHPPGAQTTQRWVAGPAPEVPAVDPPDSRRLLA